MAKPVEHSIANTGHFQQKGSGNFKNLEHLTDSNEITLVLR